MWWAETPRYSKAWARAREGVGAGTLQRRAMNPVSISVQLRCNGQPAAATLALGALQAGQRYSVFVVPAAGSTRLFLAADSVSR